MNTILVAYDLEGADQTEANYLHLKSQLKLFYNADETQSTVWLLNTDKTAFEVWNDMKSNFNSVQDKLLVVDITNQRIYTTKAESMLSAVLKAIQEGLNYHD